MIDLAASHPHYLEHLLPVWREIPAEHRGDVYLPDRMRPYIPGSLDHRHIVPSSTPILVAGFDDVHRIGGRPFILMEHGIGQSYGAVPEAAHHPSYAGGTGRHAVCGFLDPNEYAAQRNRDAYPGTFVEVVGSPRLAALQQIPAPEPDEIPTVAVTFHFDCTLVMESRNAWSHWVGAVAELARDSGFRVLGHAHPRLFRDVAPTYRDMGIEPVADFTEVLQRAHVLVADNTSVLFYFAALRGPVVVLDAPWYRVNVHHGLRFWDAADVGPRIYDPHALPLAIRSALARQPWPGAEERLARVFPSIAEPAKAAAAAAVKAAGFAGQARVRGTASFPRTGPLLP